MAPYFIRYPLVPQEGSEGIKPESRVVMKCLILSRLFGLAPILASYVPTLAGMFTWSNIPIVGKDPSSYLQAWLCSKLVEEIS